MLSTKYEMYGLQFYKSAIILATVAHLSNVIFHWSESKCPVTVCNSAFV